jgi:thiaminase
VVRTHRWIADYSSREYLVHPALSERLLDGMCGHDTDEDALAALYDKGMVLELAFFDAQPLGQGRAEGEEVKAV